MSEKLEEEIRKKEQETRDLLKLQKHVSKKHLEKQIGLRLEDLQKLYNKRN